MLSNAVVVLADNKAVSGRIDGCTGNVFSNAVGVLPDDKAADDAISSAQSTEALPAVAGITDDSTISEEGGSTILKEDYSVELKRCKRSRAYRSLQVCCCCLFIAHSTYSSHVRRSTFIYEHI